MGRPQVRLHGDVDDEMFRVFRREFDAAEDRPDDPTVIELTTFGGDADTARRIALDIRLHRERSGRRVLVFGRTSVFSSGVTILAAVPPPDRWLSRDATLLIHGRSLSKSLELSGPLSVERVRVQALLSEIDWGLQREREDFEHLVRGTALSLPEVLERAPASWYLDAPEALARGLVAGLI